MRWMLVHFCSTSGAIKYVFPWAIFRDHSCVFLTDTYLWRRWVTVAPLHNCLTVQAAVPQASPVGWEKCWHWLPHLHCLPGLSHCVFVNTPFHSWFWKFSPLFGLGCCFPRYFFPVISSSYLGSFSFQVLWVVPVHLLFKRDPVTSRSVEVKGPESLQQEFILGSSSSVRRRGNGQPLKGFNRCTQPIQPAAAKGNNTWAVAELPEEATLTRFYTAQGLVL